MPLSVPPLSTLPPLIVAPGCAISSPPLLTTAPMADAPDSKVIVSPAGHQHPRQYRARDRLLDIEDRTRLDGVRIGDKRAVSQRADHSAA